MSTKVWLSHLGRAVDPEAATVSVFDRGFLYGDSVYETIRTVHGRPFELAAHLERLRRSAAGIDLAIPFAERSILAAIDETLAAAGNDESRIRIVVTRGTGPLALDTRTSADPLMVIYVQPLVLPSEEDYRRGISAVVVPVVKGMAEVGLKTGNYLPNVLAVAHAVAHAGDDAIMCNAAGAIAEGATSNVFMVVAGGRPMVKTPSVATGVLQGITRRAVIEVTRELGVEVEETTITPAELRAAAEVFLTSTVRGVIGVTRLDGLAIGEGSEGPLTRRIREAHQAYVLRPTSVEGPV